MFEDLERMIELKYITGGQALETAEADILEAVMRALRFNQSKAAVSMGMSRGCFRNKLKQHFGDKYCGERS